MFDKIRDLGYKKITGIILLALICLVFVFLGAPTQQLGVGGGVAATVDNVTISVGDFRRELQRMEERYASIFGGQMGASRQFLRSAALENLISRQVVAQGAQRQGLMATDAEIQNLIVDEIPAFQEDGRFRRSLYERYLQSARTSPGKFEEALRNESLSLRARRAFEWASTPTPEELTKEVQLKKDRVNLSFVKIDPQVLQKKNKISPGDVRQSLKGEGFRKKVAAYYEENKSQFEQKEQVRARHILIKAKKGDGAAEQKALSKIGEIQDKLKKGESFAELAVQYSEDPGSKGKGGDLEFFARGQMVPEFEKAAFNLKKGEMSPPVQTNYGYHLILVEDRKEAQTQSLSSQQKSIATQILQKEKADKALAEIEKVLKSGNKAQLNGLIKKWSLKWQDTGDFDRSASSIPKVGEDVEALSGVFSLKNGEFWNKFSVQGGARYILKMKKRSEDKKVSSVDGQRSLKEQLTQSFSRELFNDWLNAEKSEFSIERNAKLLSR